MCGCVTRVTRPECRRAECVALSRTSAECDFCRCCQYSLKSSGHARSAPNVYMCLQIGQNIGQTDSALPIENTLIEISKHNSGKVML